MQRKGTYELYIDYFNAHIIEPSLFPASMLKSPNRMILLAPEFARKRTLIVVTAEVRCSIIVT